MSQKNQSAKAKGLGQLIKKKVKEMQSAWFLPGTVMKSPPPILVVPPATLQKATQFKNVQPTLTASNLQQAVRMAQNKMYMSNAPFVGGFTASFGDGHPLTPEDYCRICGKETNNPRLVICVDCAKTYGNSMVTAYMYKSHRKKVCRDCLSHMNACTCEKTKAVRDLRK